VYDVYSPAIGASGSVIAYGHWGRPLLVFPSEQGRAVDYENNGMVGAVSWLIDAGRVKLYCVDAFDAQTWSRTDLPVEERAARHGAYESWIIDQVVPFVYDHWMQPRGLSRGEPRAAPSRPVSPRHGPLRKL
jgi:esterase/lipase superfamily enzyme